MGDTGEFWRDVKKARKAQKQERARAHRLFIQKLRDQGVRIDVMHSVHGHYRIHGRDGEQGDVWVTTGTARIGETYQRGSGLRWLLNQLMLPVDNEGRLAWVPADSPGYKLCPLCTEPALEGEVECSECGATPEDDETWRTVNGGGEYAKV